MDDVTVRELVEEIKKATDEVERVLLTIARENNDARAWVGTRALGIVDARVAELAGITSDRREALESIRAAAGMMSDAFTKIGLGLL